MTATANRPPTAEPPSMAATNPTAKGIIAPGRFPQREKLAAKRLAKAPAMKNSLEENCRLPIHL